MSLGYVTVEVTPAVIELSVERLLTVALEQQRYDGMGWLEEQISPLCAALRQAVTPPYHRAPASQRGEWPYLSEPLATHPCPTVHAPAPRPIISRDRADFAQPKLAWPLDGKRPCCQRRPSRAFMNRQSWRASRPRPCLRRFSATVSSANVRFSASAAAAVLSACGA